MKYYEICKSYLSTDQKDNVYCYNANVISLFQVNTSEIMYPYGYYAVAPKDAIGVTFNLYGQPENKITIPYDPRKRFKDGKVGEVIIGNQERQTTIYFKDDGSIEITTNSQVLVNGDVTATGDITDGEGTSISDIKSTYNTHTHTSPAGGNTGIPNNPI